MPVILWGFLVGFVGWGACFRLAEPIAAWLLDHQGRVNGFAVGVSRLLVTLFLIFAILMAIGVMPLFLIVWQNVAVSSETHTWRSLYVASYISSLIGFFFLGLIRRYRVKHIGQKTPK